MQFAQVRKYAGSVLPVALLMGTQALAAETKWRIEAESPQAYRDKTVKIVEDAEASGGQAVEVPTTGVPNWNVLACGFPEQATPGRYSVSLRLRMENAADLGKAWRLDVREDAKLLAYGVAYGVYLKSKQGYQDFALPCDWVNAAKRPALYMRWTGVGGTPVLRIDAYDFTRIGDLPPVRIAKVWPDKLRYRTKEEGQVTVAVENLTDRPQRAEVHLQLAHDLEEPKAVGDQPVTVEAGKTAEVSFALKHGGGLFGYAARATLTLGGKEVDTAEEVFCVHDNPWAVATGARDEEWGDYYPIWHHIFYSIGATDAEIEEGALNARKEYTTCTEFFSWSPGECFYMAPKEPFWIRGNGGDLLRSKREIQREVAELHRHGIACITYIAYQAMGEQTLQLIREKPEWFIYSPDTGDHLEFYTVNELEKRKAFWESFDWARWEAEANPESKTWISSPERWKKYEEFWQKYAEEVRKMAIIGYFDPNYKVQRVVDYCADQVIASAKMFGWDGLRWDCGHLNTGPIWGSFRPFVDFYGKPLAGTPDEMVSQTVANLKRLKARVHKQLPDFVLGTNYGSWMETHMYPKMTEELCRDGGWMLDEFSYGYNAPQSPYHWWDKYYAIMADEGEHVTSLGGHYNPFAFNRNGGKYPVDRLYETIFRIAGHGHPNAVYFNSRTPAGNFAQFCVRFGRFVFDPKLRRVDKPEELVKVESAATLWWNRTVYRLAGGSGEFLVVHLVNPPVATEIESDPMSRLNPPVDNVTVSVKLPAGKTQATAWVLTAESWRLGEAPKTQALKVEAKVVGGQATVTVPEVLYWKMVVFRFG